MNFELHLDPFLHILKGGGVMVMQTWKNYHIPELYKETWSISQVKPYRYVASRNAALSFIFNINFSQILRGFDSLHKKNYSTYISPSFILYTIDKF